MKCTLGNVWIAFGVLESIDVSFYSPHVIENNY